MTELVIEHFTQKLFVLEYKTIFKTDDIYLYKGISLSLFKGIHFSAKEGYFLRLGKYFKSQ